MIKKINILTKENNYSIEIEVNSIKKKIKNIISNNSNVIFLIDKKVFNVFKKINNYKKQKYICINCTQCTHTKVIFYLECVHRLKDTFSYI